MCVFKVLLLPKEVVHSKHLFFGFFCRIMSELAYDSLRLCDCKRTLYKVGILYKVNICSVFLVVLLKFRLMYLLA